MSMSSPAESKGLPDWAFRLYMGVFYVIAIFMVSVAFANVSALLSPFLVFRGVRPARQGVEWAAARRMGEGLFRGPGEQYKGNRGCRGRRIGVHA